MKDPNLAIRKAYAALLKGKIKLSGVVVPICDRPPEGEPSQYVRVAEQTSTDTRQMKRCPLLETTILFDIVTTFLGKNQGGKKESDLIAEQLIALCLPDSDERLDLGPDFQLVDSSIELNTTQETQTDTTYYQRRLIRLRNLVYQI